MTLYEKFKALELDLSQLELEPGDTEGGYFCTPEGAEVIGWAGVDGIHFCFVEGFGEMVFAVSPANCPGEYVHPLARNFQDFLRLVLACGGTAALEQAWQWNRGEFDSFLETYPPEPEQQAVLDALGERLALSPMDDPYGYMRKLQAAFEYSDIPFSQEYYDTVPEEEPPAPPERPDWAVYFEGGFNSRHTGRGKPGSELPVNKTFTWDGRTWHIPAVYACGKGLVVDFCVEVDLSAYAAFEEKWRPLLEGDRPLTPEELERRVWESPLHLGFNYSVTVNGRELRPRSGSGHHWIPPSARPGEEWAEYNDQDWESIWFMEHYGLDQEKGWVFWRQSFLWATRTKPTVKTLSLLLTPEPKPFPGPRFTVSQPGDTVTFSHPVTGAEHTLTVVEYQEKNLEHTLTDGAFEYPTHYTALAYTVEPELPQGSLTVQDCGQGDSPRPNRNPAAGESVVASTIGVIGGIDGPTAISVFAFPRSDGGFQSACSALRFEPPRQIQWRLTFYQKMAEDMAVELLP